LGGRLIAVVDDNESIRESLTGLFRSLGFQVKAFGSAELFLASDALKHAECLILDVRMPGMDGLDLQLRLNAIGSRVPIIFISAHDDEARRRQAMARGAVEFFQKPFAVRALVTAVQTALERHGGTVTGQNA
jgi:FixJ family two-component response regulator